MGKLGSAFANVKDYGATGLGRGHNDMRAIQRAIDSGRNLLFPAGTYQLAGLRGAEALVFRTPGQRALFLQGSRLAPQAPDTWIRITAPDQVFRGMFLDPGVVQYEPDGPFYAHDPILEITGADNLVIEDLYTHSGANTTQVRVSNTAGVTFRNSWITGSWDPEAPSSTIGLEIAENVSGLRLSHCGITEMMTALVVSADTSDLTFTDSTFESGGEVAVSLRSGRTDGLLMQGCHFEGTDRLVHLELQDSATLAGALFAGCEFGVLRTPVSPASSSVFRIAGTVEGMVVKGCYRGAGGNPTEYVWEFVAGCRVRNCEDRFNHWDKVTIVAGADLRTQWSNDGSALALKAPSVRFTAEKVGFFGAAPVARERYFVPAYTNRTLVHGNEVPVLATLIRDLAALGLLRV